MFCIFVYRRGSVIVSFVVYFATPVTTDEGLAELREAVNNGFIGTFKVSDLTVVDPQPTPPPSEPTTITTPEEKTTQKAPGLCILISVN